MSAANDAYVAAAEPRDQRIAALLAALSEAEGQRDAAVREQARLHGLIDDLRVGLFWSEDHAAKLLARRPVMDRTECASYAEGMLDRTLLDSISESAFLASLPVSDHTGER